MNKLSIILPLTLTFSGAIGSLTQAEVVIEEDLIVIGSACVGSNCTAGLKFFDSSTQAGTFNTLNLDRTDPSILFSDTSNSPNFPSADWRVGVDSSNNFAISNDTTQTNVFVANAAGDAVAIGAGATLTAGTVSVGGLRIANVADGVAVSDAATLGQLNAAIASLPADLSTLLDLNASNLAQLNTLSSAIDAVGAIGSAMSALQINPRSTGDHSMSIGLGSYEGTTAFAVGSFHFLADDSIFMNTGVSVATNGTGGTAARFGITFGQ